MKKMESKKKKKSPSREKYEKENPTVSARVPKTLRDSLRIAKEKEGMSFTDILKVGLDLLEVKIRAEEEVRQEAYEEGQLSGYELAMSDYKVTYPCSICGKPIDLQSPEGKAAASRYMREHGWGHAECHERKRWQ